MALTTQGFYRFGPFRLDVQQKILFLEDRPVPLTPKAFETLLALVESGGRLVTKAELMDRVWPDTFVAEANLVFQISEVRKALGEEQKNRNGFIQTVPRRGYRFVGVIETEATTAELTDAEFASDQPIIKRDTLKAHRSTLIARMIVWAAAIGLLSGVGIAVFRPLPAPRILHTFPLTRDGKNKGSLFTYANQVYFSEVDGASWRTFSVSAAGGATLPIPLPFRDALVLDISTPQSRMLFERSDQTLWTVGPPSGLPRRVSAPVSSGTARFSHDGRQIAYAGYPTENEIYVMNSDGTNPRRIATLPGDVQAIRWSPSGSYLRFSVYEKHVDIITTSIWQVGVDGSAARPLLPDWHERSMACCGDWTADGRYYIFQSPAMSNDREMDLWAIREGSRLFHRPTPVPLLSGPISLYKIAPGTEQNRLFALGFEPKAELSVWDPQRRAFVPHMRGPSAEWVAFARDGSWLAYVDFETKTLWRMQADGTGAKQLSYEPLMVDGVSISPDGQTIAFRGYARDRLSKIYLIPAIGGEPEPMIAGSDQPEGVPSWSSDGRRIAFGDVPAKFGEDDRSHAIRVYDREKKELSSLPGSEGLWTARWSPDGRYICAVTISNSPPLAQDLKLYDLKTQTWFDFQVNHVSDPVWSRDSKYIYFSHEGSPLSFGVFRVSLSGELSQVADFSSIRSILRIPGWLGLTQQDSPLVLRNVGTEEIYSLEINWP